ncbi:serine/threonine protein kinase [Diplonema papillatum]|nr:serine/threonine protein kinase [Diplonema papillatum]KAJ9468070.1 serine/threonine protein kinase [Diplonema papillatum]
MSAVTVIVSVGTLWAASATIAVNSLTSAREEQLSMSAYQTGREIVSFFSSTSSVAAIVAGLYNSSAVKNTTQPLEQFYNDYADSLYFAIRTTYAFTTLSILLPGNGTQGDCDHDGVFLSLMFGALVSPLTATGPPGCGEPACKTNFSLHWLEGDGNPANPTAMRPDGPRSYSCPSFITAEGKALGRDASFMRPRWASESDVKGGPEDGGSALFRSVYFRVNGPPWNPGGAVGELSKRITEMPQAGSTSRATFTSILSGAAAVSEYDDLILLLSDQGKLIAASDAGVETEEYSGSRLLGFHRADNETALGSDVAEIGRHVLAEHCASFPCDWSAVDPAPKRTGSRMLVLQPLSDNAADGLNYLLAVSVRHSEVVKPAADLNFRLAFISLSVLAVLACLSFLTASYIAKPISQFSARLLAASAMSNLTGNTEKRLVVEINSMQDSLNTLVAQLLEYKTFLPAGMFETRAACDDSTSDERPSITLTGSIPSSSERQPKPAAAPAAVVAPESYASTRCVLKTRPNVTIFVANVRHSLEYMEAETDYDRLLAAHREYISLFAAGLSNKGTIDRFNGDRVVASFGANPNTVPCSGSTACKIVLGCLQNIASIALDYARNGVAAGLAKGKMLAGNSGDRALRAFNLMGPSLNIAWKLSDIATSLCPAESFEMVLDNVLFKDVHLNVDTVPVGLLQVGDKFSFLPDSSVPRKIYLVRCLRQTGTDDEEWMYQILKLEEAEGTNSLPKLMDRLLEPTVDSASYELCRPCLQRHFTAFRKQILIDRLATSFETFKRSINHTL